MKVDIFKIKIGNRIREEMGDISSLENSINLYGLFNPIIINQNYELLAGARRLTACKNLGWNEIEVKIISTKNELAKIEIEGDENFMRKDFTDFEIEKIIEKKRKLARKGIINKIKYVFNLIISFIKSIWNKLFNKMNSPHLKRN